jgi:hypothetical protein
MCAGSGYSPIRCPASSAAPQHAASDTLGTTSGRPKRIAGIARHTQVRDEAVERADQGLGRAKGGGDVPLHHCSNPQPGARLVMAAHDHSRAPGDA